MTRTLVVLRIGAAFYLGASFALALGAQLLTALGGGK
jgi:hypothetical protein